MKNKFINRFFPKRFDKYWKKIEDSKDLDNTLRYITNNFIKSKVKELSKKKILFCGFSYKENVGDFRNSPTKALIKSLKIRKNLTF